MPDSAIRNKAKEAAGKHAADLVVDGMCIGLGTGSTTAFFIEALIARCRQGLKVRAAATSLKTRALAEAGGIPLINDEDLTWLDLCVDGADEIDPKKQMIKGGGGALLREKIVASMAQEMIVIVDEDKLVKQLGHFPLPVEIAPFAYQATLAHLLGAGLTPMIRKTADHTPYKTDNGNLIADLHFENGIDDPVLLDRKLKSIAGVIETGLFIHMAGRVIIGHPNGTVTIK